MHRLFFGLTHGPLGYHSFQPMFLQALGHMLEDVRLRGSLAGIIKLHI